VFLLLNDPDGEALRELAIGKPLGILALERGTRIAM
jgi:hypothetical protein